MLLIDVGHTQSHHQTKEQEGGFGGLSPPNKAPSPPKLKYETLQNKWVWFSQILECQSSLHKHKKVPLLLLKTFWQQFWSHYFSVNSVYVEWYRKMQNDLYLGALVYVTTVM